MKNPTPKNIVLLATSILSVVMFLFLVVLKYFFSIELDYTMIFSVVILLFIVSYLVFFYLLEQFIYRKIKVIYKYIHDVKKPDLVNHIQMQDDVIQDIEDEVSQWASTKKQEIAQFKKTEKFRRDYLGNVSHELKTPIFNIQGYIESLIDGGRKDKIVTKKFLKKALENVNRLGVIVEDLEMISRTETGELQLNYQEFNICNLISEIMESLEMQAEEANVRISFKDSSQKSFRVSADQERIRQVLMNLTLNAIKYNKRKGNVYIACYDMEENILVEITDTGIGIEEKHISRLYERFYRVDKNRSRNKGGTGLGLAIVKHIIEAHNQTINVRSRIDLGSTFGFTLKKVKDTF